MRQMEIGEDSVLHLPRGAGGGDGVGRHRVPWGVGVGTSSGRVVQRAAAQAPLSLAQAGVGEGQRSSLYRPSSGRSSRVAEAREEEGQAEARAGKPQE